MSVMVHSMTGFGRGEAEAAGRRFVAEVRSVNARFLEAAVRLPQPDAALEDRLRRLVRERVARGRVEVTVTATGAAAVHPVVDRALVLSYHNLLKDLAESLEIDYEFDLEDMVQLPGVLRLEEAADDREAARAAVVSAVGAALDGLAAMREAEGVRLAADMLDRLARLEELAEVIAGRGPAAVAACRERLSVRLAELLAPGQVDESRLAMEVALLAERADITEELVRLRSHLAEGRRLLRDGGPDGVGRQFEFLLQEMHRELNTIGAKGADLAIARAVLQAKGELEKLREQAQNVE